MQESDSPISTPIVPVKRGWRFQDLVGTRFTRLVVTELISMKPTIWLCRCDCGADTAVGARHLKSGVTQSCGCLHREIMVARNSSHGLCELPEYSIWLGMRNRCNNPNEIGWKNYGGRGISVCERWNSFENFLADMGNRPSSSHSIDRFPNPNGNYEPSNCRWATDKDQARNTRRNRMLTAHGKTQCLAAWSEELVIPASRIIARLNRGWNDERALFEL